MGKYTQEPHQLSIETPLGNDVLYLIGFDGHEEFSRLFKYKLEMFSDDANIDPKAIVGKKVTVEITFPDQKPRKICGHIVKFSNLGTGARGTQYRAEMVPWLWFLTKTSDCRIFQKKTAQAIIEQIFKDLGFNDFEFKCKPRPEREYCVQYRESDFNFVARLMEEEGIFYFFKHENGKHTLVCADAASAYVDAEEEDKEVSWDTSKAGDIRNDELMGWEHQYEFRSGKWMMSDYNFKKPNNTLNPTYKILEVNSPSTVSLEGNDKLEHYDYAGEHEEKSQGNDLVKYRMEAEELGYDVATGTSICRSFGPGVKFSIKKHQSKQEEGKKYVITSISHMARVGSYITGGGAAESTYSNSFTCVPDNVIMRPARLTPKPVINGLQTAVVTGPPGEEIWPDEYGRVKVQFHWDREGKMDDKSSCWIRCSMPTAGREWGFMGIPRVGQEVVVAFMEGDPDRPLITGTVYNPGQMPSRKLPDMKTKCGWKSNSTPGGEGHNEMTWDDLKGKEQFYIHGEKDMDIRCKNNYNQIVGYEKEEGTYRQLVHKDKEVVVYENLIEHTKGKHLVLVDKEQHIIIKQDKVEQVDGENNLIVKQAVKENFKMKHSLEVGMDQHVKVGMNQAVEAGMQMHLKGGMEVVIEAGLSLTLKVGGNFINISPAGVAIQGTMVLINSGGAAGAGNGSSPEAPKEAEEAKPKDIKDEMNDYSKTGKKSCPSGGGGGGGGGGGY